jgi:hypothetical protein
MEGPDQSRLVVETLRDQLVRHALGLARADFDAWVSACVTTVTEREPIRESLTLNLLSET